MIEEHIKEDTQCCEENELIFRAASLVYKLEKNKHMQKIVDKKLAAYEEKVDKELLDMEDLLF